MSNPLSKAAEEKVLSAVQTICERVAGVDAGDLQKTALDVAQRNGFGPDMIRLMCAGYNTGATTFQREQGGGILQKHAEFPLADAEKIIASLYPSVSIAIVKESSSSTTISDEYARPPRNLAKAAASIPMKKVAAETIPLTYDRTVKTADVVEVLSKSKQLQREIKEAKQAVLRAEEELLSTVAKLAYYFKQSSVDRRWTVGEVKYAAAKRFGKAGELVMRAVDQHNNYTVDTATPPKRAIDWQASPFTELHTSVKLASAVNDAKNKHVQVVLSNRTKIAELTSPYRLPAPTKTASKEERSVLLSKKEAVAPAAINLAVVSGALKNLGGDYLKPTSTDALMRGKMEDLSDPEHEESLRRIRTQAMLQNLLTGDEVLSSHDPEQVLLAYNDLNSLAPRAAQQPAVARTILRKWMSQGSIEPFEAKEVSDLENNLTKTHVSPALPRSSDESPSNVLARRPSILGG